jgi:hypothetical protein
MALQRVSKSILRAYHPGKQFHLSRSRNLAACALRSLVCSSHILIHPLLNCRYALDVNIGTLDVLNHKRLLDSARADPSAVSFQVRPVDVISGVDPARKPSFGSLEVASLSAVSSPSEIPSSLFLQFLSGYSRSPPPHHQARSSVANKVS